MADADRVTSEEIAVYRAGGQRRWERTREERALAKTGVGCGAACCCTAKGAVWCYACRGVWLTAARGLFTLWSDVDLAAWGIRPEDTFRAIGAVADSGAEIELNLVDIETARPLLRAAIEREGVEL